MYQPHPSSSFDLGPPPPPFADDDLPSYTNDVRLATLCYRKREFNASFDKTSHGRRNWELVWLVLDGTALRVYKAEKDERRAIERADADVSQIGHQMYPQYPDQISGILLPGLMYSSISDSSFSSYTSSPSGGSHTSLPKARQQPSGPGREFSIASSIYFLRSQSTSFGASTSSLLGAVMPPRAGTMPAIKTPEFARYELLKQYPLQHAICMKADPSTKRKNVLRFILQDGKQFLVQLFSRAATVAWMQVYLYYTSISLHPANLSSAQLMSIAAPLSLDLDERPMPEPAYYPRRLPGSRVIQRQIISLETLPTGVSMPSIGSTTFSLHRKESMPGEDYGDNLEDEQEMDHLPPPRMLPMVQSLSSVDQARRLGVQL